MLRHFAPGGVLGHEHALAGFAVLGRSGGGATVCVPCGGPGTASARVSRKHGAFAVDAYGDVRFVALRPAVVVPRTGAPRLLPSKHPVRLEDGDAVAVGPVPAPLTRARVAASMHCFALAATKRGAVTLNDGVLCCDVCSEVLRGARVLPCGHSYCFDCLWRWLATNASCPSCRARVDAAAAAAVGWPCRALDVLAQESAHREKDEEALAATQTYTKLVTFR
jgi:hypothetical protein